LEILEREEVAVEVKDVKDGVIVIGVREIFGRESLCVPVSIY
jgi:hypothetical protein